MPRCAVHCDRRGDARVSDRSRQDYRRAATHWHMTTRSPFHQLPAWDNETKRNGASNNGVKLCPLTGGRGASLLLLLFEQRFLLQQLSAASSRRHWGVELGGSELSCCRVDAGLAVRLRGAGAILRGRHAGDRGRYCGGRARALGRRCRRLLRARFIEVESVFAEKHGVWLPCFASGTEPRQTATCWVQETDRYCEMWAEEALFRAPTLCVKSTLFSSFRSL